MAKIPEKKNEKRKSGAATFLSWVVDLSILGLLIWYFSNPTNQSSFWTTISNWFTNAVTVAVDFQTKNKATPGNMPEPKPEEEEASAPPPPPFIPPPLPTEEQIAQQVPGDCFPPEVRSMEEDAPPVAKLFYHPPAIPKQKKSRTGHGKPVEFAKKKIKNVPFYQITINLNDPDTYLVIRLPKDAQQANSTTFFGGHENFDSFVKRVPSAAMVNGTFFSKDEQERVMGNMVSEGKMLKYSPWENYGTTLGLLEGDYPEMVTARAEGKPNWDKHWFSLTCGPRLLKQGEVWLNPALEGFADPHVLGIGPRSAIGFTKSRDKLYLITFLHGLSLKEEAKLMKEIGCYEAMNLDGGASKGLSIDRNVVMKPGRALTNVLVVYDCKHKAPPNVVASWEHFQQNNAETVKQASLF